jgi:hypothetical protein
MAATTSPLANPKAGSENIVKNAASASKCNIGKSVNKAAVWDRLRPNPLENALENALRQIASRTDCS